MAAVYDATSYFAGMGFPLILANAVDKQTAIRSCRPMPSEWWLAFRCFYRCLHTRNAHIVMPGGIADLDFIDPVEAIDRWFPNQSGASKP